MDYLKRYPQIFISLICIACYLPFANIGFLSDDFTFLQHYQSECWGMISSNFYDAFFIPVTHIIQLILLDVFNQNAFLIHITQIILHFYIAVLIYRIALENLYFKPYSAILSSIFFILIPYQSEAIFWFSSIGYQCCLMLTLVAIRSYFKNQILSYCLFFILSIHSKEIGYTTPIFIYAFSYFTKEKKKNLYLLYSFLIVILSLISRYLVLGELVGGYGEITHLNFQLTSMLKVIGGYFIKFFSFSRYATSSGLLITQCLLIISILTPIISSSLSLGYSDSDAKVDAGNDYETYEFGIGLNFAFPWAYIAWSASTSFNDYKVADTSVDSTKLRSDHATTTDIMITKAIGDIFPIIDPNRTLFINLSYEKTFSEANIMNYDYLADSFALSFSKGLRLN